MLRHLLMGLALTGCGTGAIGEAVRPEAPTAVEALGDTPEAGDCKNIGAARPLIVDWSSQSRLDLELAMKRGLAVVHYDCDGIRLLPSCSIEGDYAFVGVSRKEDVIQLTTADELAANLPLSAVKIQSSMERDSSIDLALVMVGKQMSAVADPSRVLLQGSCEGATHVVRAATVGAFAMARGSAGKARAVVDLFGAGAKGSSESRSNRGSKDGDLKACRESTSDAGAAPDQCQAPMRIDLHPLAEGASNRRTNEGAPISTTATRCPEGLVEIDGKCTNQTDEEPGLCDRHDVTACQQRCADGHGGSCANFGELLLRGAGIEKDEAKALAAFRKACNRGHFPGCHRAEWAQRNCHTRFGKEDPRCDADKHALLQKGCDGGHGQSCATLAFFTKDQPARSSELMERACKLAHPGACEQKAKKLMAQKDASSADVAHGLMLYERGCDAGSNTSCRLLLEIYGEGRYGVAKNELKRAEIHTKLCNRVWQSSCYEAGTAFQHAPPGVSRDLARAETLFRAGCKMKGSSIHGGEVCLQLAVVIEARAMSTGRGASDEQRREALEARADACDIAGIQCKRTRRALAKRMYAANKKACVGGDADACEWLQLRMSERGCLLKNDADSCKNLSEEAPTRYRRVREQQCLKTRDANSDACTELVELGGTLPKSIPSK